MRRLFLLAFFALGVITSSAQIHPLGSTMERALDLLGQGNTEEAFNYWSTSSDPYKTDSLYIWASAYLAQDFMNHGNVAEAEALLNNAEQALNLKSDSYWWFQQSGYVSIKKASLYCLMHDYVSARVFAANAKIAFEHIAYRGVDYAVALSVLAEVALINGDEVLARTFAGQALLYAAQVFNTTLDKEDYPYLAYVMRENALVEQGLGYYQTAITAFETLKELNQQFGIDDSTIDLYLGMTFVSNGDYDKAVRVLSPYYENCEVVQSKISSGINLLYAKYQLGHNDISQLAYDIAKYQAGNVSRMFSFMSDQEKEKWWMSNENSIISVADEVLLHSGIKGVNGIIADNEIFSKGLLLRSSNLLKKAALNSNDESVMDSYYALEVLRGKLSDSVDKAEQSRLEHEIAAIEKELQSKLGISVDEVFSWQDVASSLENKEVALEFVRFDILNRTNNADYYAIIVKKGDKEPRIIHLFDEASLRKLLDNPSNRRIDIYITELYSTGAPQYKGEQLYNLVWSTLEKEIKGYKTIYYSPAGLLNSVSLQAISNGKQCLGQRYVMHQVSSIGEIPHIKKESPNTGNHAVIYGGVQYDAEEPELIQASRSYPRGSSDWDTGLSGGRSGWKQLPGTEVEAKEIGSILNGRGYSIEILSGIEANEESFKDLSGKDISIIHIATHGFFLSEQREIKKNAFLNPTMSEHIGRIDPMLRSGLLFAGANRAWTGKRNIEGIDDGILTAKEISALNLTKVHLAVLSACQTGLGDVESNEGVYGLQRAFKLAGAETLIMSLWEVDDRATSLLMKAFYEEYLSGKTKDSAFRNAINSIRTYKDKNGDEPFSSPFYWAAFILLD